MQGFLALSFVISALIVAVYGTMIGGLVLIEMRDCRIINGEKCAWILVPRSDLPADLQVKP